MPWGEAEDGDGDSFEQLSSDQFPGRGCLSEPWAASAHWAEAEEGDGGCRNPDSSEQLELSSEHVPGQGGARKEEAQEKEKERKTDKKQFFGSTRHSKKKTLHGRPAAKPAARLSGRPAGRLAGRPAAKT